MRRAIAQKCPKIVLPMTAGDYAGCSWLKKIVNDPSFSERYTPWFSVADGELPTRVGAYEGSGWGIPHFHDYAFEQMYYFWDGRRFSGSGRTPNEATPGDFTLPVGHWRGLSARGKSSKLPRGVQAYTGTVALVTPHHFGLRIERLVIDGSRARFRFATEEADPCTMKGETRRNGLGWYISSYLKIERVSVRSSAPTRGAIVFRVEQHAGCCFVYGFWKQEDEDDKTFCGQLLLA